MTTTETLRHRRQDLRDAIWQHGPEHFNMSAWYSAGRGEDYCDGLLPEVDHFDIQACGTTACAAGHGFIIMADAGLVDDVRYHADAVERVHEYFGLPSSLFYMDQWQWVVVDQDRTLADIYNERRDANADEPEGALVWSVVIGYLDGLIKGDA